MKSSTAHACVYVHVRVGALNACVRYSNFYSTRGMIIFSATSRTSCARSLFFTAEDFQTPHPYRALSSGFMMKLLGTACIALSLEDIPHVARHVFIRSCVSEFIGCTVIKVSTKIKN